MKPTDTIRDLRLASGKSHDDIVSFVASFLGKPKKSIRASVMWEFRGVNHAGIVSALAAFYRISVDDIRRASDNSRQGVGPSLRPGRPKNTITNSVFSS